MVTQVSRFDPWKGQHEALEALRRVLASIPDARLLLVGVMASDDPEGPAVFERTREEAADDPAVSLLRNQPTTTVNYL